jgi:MATE family multidrug resistance protein
MLGKQKDLSCSVMNVLAAAIPMMASILSGALMELIDRAFLAHYSIIAMNGASLAQQIYNTLLLPFLCFVSMSEVFVGQFNGANNFYKTSSPIVQIAIFVCLLEALIAPIQCCYRHSIIPDVLYADGFPYLVIGWFTIPLQIFHAAISSFFVGTRRPSMILSSVIIGNIVNITFDYILIFGVPGVINPMGATGAAIATLIGAFISLSIMVVLYFNNTNAENYGTRHIRIDAKILKKNVMLSTPYAAALMVDMGTWVMVTNVLAKVSIEEVTTNSACLTIWTFLIFILEGLQKGVVALASNCIGAKVEYRIATLIRSVIKISMCLALFTMLLFVVFPGEIFRFCFGIENFKTLPHCQVILFVQWVSFSIITFSVGGLIGVLRAGGDENFITLIRTTSFSIFVITPVIVASSLGLMTTLVSWSLGGVNIVVAAICFWLRYKSGRWRRMLV